ncbi:hypothetical protein [Streptomyces sp. NPDC017964]|uniref:hypothetical protein n=1 Tax=Streptomyces sp. NPDC017964 TaxID=3365022 RepID=UPI003798C897
MVRALAAKAGPAKPSLLISTPSQVLSNPPLSNSPTVTSARTCRATDARTAAPMSSAGIVAPARHQGDAAS